MTTIRLRGGVLTLASLLLAAPASAQEMLQLGRPVEATLDDRDPTFDNGSHFEIWRFRGTAGQRVAVTLRSEHFDTFLAVGTTAGRGCTECMTNDDGAGGTDSRVRMTLPRTGVYEVAVSAFDGRGAGVYTLALDELPPLEPTGEVRAGQTVHGELDPDDATLDDASHVELWTYRGAPGERIVVTLHSADFDAYVGWGRLVDGEWQELDSDDDSGGGTDSRLEVTLGDDGVYQLAARALFAGETGRYTLRVER